MDQPPGFGAEGGLPWCQRIGWLLRRHRPQRQQAHSRPHARQKMTAPPRRVQTDRRLAHPNLLRHKVKFIGQQKRLSQCLPGIERRLLRPGEIATRVVDLTGLAVTHPG